MKNKTGLAFILALGMVFGLTSMGIAADDDPCYTCPKCEQGIIACPGEQQAGNCALNPENVSYESDYRNNEAAGEDDGIQGLDVDGDGNNDYDYTGIIPNFNANGPDEERIGFHNETENCKYWFNICQCQEDVCDPPIPGQISQQQFNDFFQAGKSVGLRMKIMTEGVYWTNQPAMIQAFRNPVTCGPSGYECGDNPEFEGMFPDEDFDGSGAYEMETTADTNNNGEFDREDIRFRNYNPLIVLQDGEPMPAPGYDATPNTNERNPEDLDVHYTYYSSTSCTPGTEVTPIDSQTQTACSVPSANRARSMWINNAYQFGPIDINRNMHNWWINIPEMRFDNSVIQPGDELVVQIDLLIGGNICPECTTCSCEVTLGVFCPPEEGAGMMFFPYVVSGLAGWQTGIVTTNLESNNVSAADMEATYTLTDSAGATFTYTKTDFDSVVWATFLDDILDDFDGGTPEPGAAWLRVETNFNVDGYSFLTDGNFGAGTLPRR